MEAVSPKPSQDSDREPLVQSGETTDKHRKLWADFENGRETEPAQIKDKDKETFKKDMHHEVKTMPQNVISEAALHNMNMWHTLESLAQAGKNVLASLFFLGWCVFMRATTDPTSDPDLPFHDKILIHMVLYCLLVLVATVLFEYANFLEPHLGLRTDGSKLECARLYLLNGSYFVRLVRRHENVVLTQPSELFKFTHAMNVGKRDIRVDMVHTREPDIPPKVLMLRDIEIQPDTFWVKSINKNKGGDLMKEVLGENRPSCLSCTWFDDKLMNSLSDTDLFPCVATLQRRSRWDFLQHSAINVILSVVLSTLAVLPILLWFWDIRQYREDLCRRNIDNAYKMKVTPALEKLMASSGKERVRVCGNFVSFVHRFHGANHISNVEWIFTLILWLVSAFVLPLYRQRYLQLAAQDKFISTCDMDEEGKIEMKAQAYMLDQFLLFPVVVERIWSMFWVNTRMTVTARWKSRGTDAINNRAFSKIVQPVLGCMTDPGSVEDSWVLPIAKDEHEDDPNFPETWMDDQVEYAQKCKAAQDRWRQTRQKWRLEDKTKNFKFQCFIRITSKEELEVFKNEFLYNEGPAGYFNQLNEIFSRERAQDNYEKGGCPTWTQARFRMGPKYIPAGMQLTHIACESASGGFKAVPIGKNEVFEKGVETLKELLKPETLKNSRLAVELPNTHNPQLFGSVVILPQAEPLNNKLLTSSDLLTSFGDDVCFRLTFIFQMTKDFYENMAKDVFSTPKSPGFHEFLDCEFRCMETVKDVKEQITKEDSRDSQGLLRQLKFAKRQCKQDTESTCFAVRIREDKVEMWRKMKQLFIWGLLPPFIAVAQCIVCILVPPCLRKYTEDGGELLPSALWWPMSLNWAMQFLLLFLFLYSFNMETRRMRLLRQVLDNFEMETNTPSKAEDVNEGKMDPFTLHLHHADKYMPGDEKSDKKWSKRWKSVVKNVEHWGHCQTNLRVLTTVSSASAQAILAIALTILLVLFLLSLWQMIQGTGIVDLDRQALLTKLNQDTVAALQTTVGKAREHAASAGDSIASAAAEGVSRATGAATRRLAGLAAGAVASGGAGDLSGAADALGRAVQPFRDALRNPLDEQAEALLAEHRRRLLSAKVKDYASTVKGVDMTKTTKTQATALLVTVIILILTAELIFHIVCINEAFARQECMLVEQKKSHRHRQREREERWLDSKERDTRTPGHTGSPTGSVAAAKSSSQIGERTGSKSSNQIGERTGSKSGNQIGDAGAPSVADNLHQTGVKDASMKGYERLLDSSIESSRQKAQQYPVTLFGQVINKALLTFLLGFAATGIYNEVSWVAGGLLTEGCEYLEKSSFLGYLQKKYDEVRTNVNAAALDVQTGIEGGLSAAASDIMGVNDTYNVSSSDKKKKYIMPKISLMRMFNQMVCKPLSKILDKQLEKLKETADKLSNRTIAGDDDAGAENRTERRLSSAVPLQRVVSRWWDAHPGDPLTKHTILQLVLNDLRHTSERLLRVAPGAALDAYVARGLGPAMDVVIMHGESGWLQGPAAATRHSGYSGGWPEL